ncbi:unnamed protein product [Albugo candida]|uniref:Uncharacterized protein n=1 Tax=Albugo candida TaxID=65357 RepID=A0A024FTR1_9STRA|nr:unnamed protein product [Albugo candida]|eukprot:CCI10337.1 unnamed protein product [Albugo candida]
MEVTDAVSQSVERAAYTIGVTSSHYVRCLKPSDIATPSKFIARRVWRAAIQFVIVFIQAVARDFVQRRRYRRQKLLVSVSKALFELQKLKDETCSNDPKLIGERQSSDAISDISSDESSRPTAISLKNAAERNDRGQSLWIPKTQSCMSPPIAVTLTTCYVYYKMAPVPTLVIVVVEQRCILLHYTTTCKWWEYCWIGMQMYQHKTPSGIHQFMLGKTKKQLDVAGGRVYTQYR